MRPIATPASTASSSDRPIQRPVNSTRPATKRRSWQRPIVVIVGSTVVLLIASIGYFASTTVEGNEIHSGNWSVRKFYFRRDPFTNYQFTNIYYDSINRSSIWTASPTKDHSRIDATIGTHLKSQAKELARWDLIEIADGSPTQSAAVILFELLQTYTDSYDLHWVEWTRLNPKKAASFWPAIQSLTLLNLYTEIHPLLDVTREELDVNQFETRINSIVQSSLIRFCEDTDDGDLASQAATIGLKYGDNPRLSEYVRKPSS